MNTLPPLLGRPAELNDKPWITVISCTVIAILALAICEPFVNRLDSNSYLCLLFGYSSITFILSALFFVVIPTAFKKYFSYPRWTIGRMYAHWGIYILILGLLGFVYEYGIVKGPGMDNDPNKAFIKLFADNIAASFVVSIIPLIVTNSLAKSRNRHSNIVVARELNQKLRDFPRNPVAAHEAEFGGASSESLIIDPNTVMYIESSGNYVSVVFREGNIFRNKLLRCTIKQMEDMLIPYSVFVRCHRAYVVNVNQISTISVCEPGFRLTLFDTLEMIPVSLSYFDELKDALK